MALIDPQVFITQFMDDIKKDFSVTGIQTAGANVLAAIQELSKIVEALSPLAAAAAPFTGSAAPAVAAAATAASAISTATDAAITAHQAAGSTPSTAAAGLASVAQAVAAQSGNIGISPTTAAQIQTMTTALAPEVIAAMPDPSGA